MIAASTLPDPHCHDVPVWKRAEVADGKSTVCWCVRLWTGQLLTFKTKREAHAAYWR